MAWRVIDADGHLWSVHPAAERRPNVSRWQLTLSFRAVDASPRSRTLWATCAVESDSKSSLFEAADRLTNDALKAILTRHLS